ncbi:hypothetical protein [Halovivax gelatinilyticus]|uniref:hypothetical protein n=1 Tax=Halovivax gelatinilyticus TaxID=2961597 RepID=UPI0020CA8134|nr:hypothetical protein [Halovivax gelatinilyticus]
MPIKRALTGDPKRTSLIYLAIGGISLVKAIALRDDRERFRRELIDAAIFIGIGLALRRFATMKEKKQAEIESMVPDWVGFGATEAPESSLRDRVSTRFGTSEPDRTGGPAETIRGIVVK